MKYEKNIVKFASSFLNKEIKIFSFLALIYGIYLAVGSAIAENTLGGSAEGFILKSLNSHFALNSSVFFMYVMEANVCFYVVLFMFISLLKSYKNSKYIKSSIL